MEQIESYTATTSIVEPPSQKEGYLLFLDTSGDLGLYGYFIQKKNRVI